MPTGYRRTQGDIVYEEDQYELTEDGRIPIPVRRTAKYQDGDTIDWLHEEGLERERKSCSTVAGGVLEEFSPSIGVCSHVVFVVTTGFAIGIAGAWLDVLVKWLGDLREGNAHTASFTTQTLAVLALTEWQSWGDYFNVHSIFGHSLLQASIYVVLAVAFAGSAALLVVTYAPLAFHTGIPEIKAAMFDAFLTPWILLIKALGLALAVASGLSLGKEGPLVHVACCVAYLLSRLFKDFRHNEGDYLLNLRSPLVSNRRLFKLKNSTRRSTIWLGRWEPADIGPCCVFISCLLELDTFANESDVMWRGFVASAIAAVSLQWVNPFGTAKLVLFQVPWVILGVVGGVLGSLLIRLNVEIALRRNTLLRRWPILEVICVSAVTAALSYLIVFARAQTSELVANLFQECDPTKGDYHGLCNPTATAENVFLLCLTAILKLILTAWTFGMMVPAGIFLPTIAVGACLGRAMGLIMQSLYRAYPTAWMFLSCPPDPSVGCISPGFYAVIGASAMLGGVTRMTISLVVILFEASFFQYLFTSACLTLLSVDWGLIACLAHHDLCHDIEMVGDAMGKDGIYSVWIAMRRYPWLPPVDYRDRGETGAHLMKPLSEVIVIEDAVTTVGNLKALLARTTITDSPSLAKQTNFVPCLDQLQLDETELDMQKLCTFSSHQLRMSPEGRVDLSNALEDSIIQLRKEVPQELVVNMFQKLNLRQVLFTHAGQLTGLVTKRDVVNLLTSHFPHAAALPQDPSRVRPP
ncbi:Cl-channel protein [Gymnopilus junonius]|uniref:Cl-channel protein n=1 Tax=Gymnopilus junonius TaxID=109634 RepID=A0A9P5NA17_GYMJU|nr:Cl-channel protein [Gymnopilus junonius]